MNKISQNFTIFHKGQSHSRSRTNHSLITHRLEFCVLVRREIGQIFRVSGTKITDESRTNHAWTAHVSFTLTDESLTYRASRHVRQFCKWYSQWNERDTCAVYAWYEGGASVDRRGRVRFQTSTQNVLFKQTRNYNLFISYLKKLE